MLKFKQIDWIVQLILIIATPLFFLINKNQFKGFEFISSYFIVGGWQAVSILVHFSFPRKIKHKLRAIHGVFTMIVGVVAAIFIALDNDALIGYLFFILFVTPILAIVYLVACYRETRDLQKQQTQIPSSLNQ